MDGKQNALHINNVLGALAKEWRRTNPEALRAIEKVNRENHGFLFMPVEIKLKFIRDVRAANFQDSQGKTIDLLSIERDAFQQKAAIAEKTPVLSKSIAKKAYQKSFKAKTDASCAHACAGEAKYLGETT